MNLLSENSKDPIISGLADKMKAATWDLHKKAETSGVVNDMLRRQITLKSYALYIRNLIVIYEALELAMTHISARNSFKPVCDPALFRTKFLRQDFEAMSSALKQNECPLLNATKDYKKNIEITAATNPAALLGHIYVRYLGDLNGGAVLARLLSGVLDLPPSMLTFYSFPEIEDLGRYRDTYRNTLNQLYLKPREISSAVTCAKEAFKLNIALSIGVKTHQY